MLGKGGGDSGGISGLDSVTRFLTVSSSDGYGGGSGYGDADGGGSGSGRGYGWGYGYGSGSGSGSGDGSGYGSGGGSGDGSGDDSGGGYGVRHLGGLAVHEIDGLQTIVISVKGNIAKGFLLQVDLSLKPCFIARVGDLFAHGDTAREAVEEANRKAMQSMPVEERVALMKSTFDNGPMTGHQLYDWHGKLTGSCRFGRDAFVKERGIDLEKAYTLEEFVALTKDQYGGDIVKMLLR